MNCSVSASLGEREREDWGRLWASSSHSHPRQHLAFADVESARGRIPLFARAEVDGRLVAIGLVGVRPVLPGTRLAADAVCARGPVFDDPAAGRALLDSIVHEMRRIGAGSVRVSPHWSHPGAAAVESLLRDAGFAPSAGSARDASGIVDLSRDEAEILASFSASTRREIRLAERRGVEFRPLEAGTETDAAFDCLAAHRRARGLPPLTRTEFDGLFRCALADGDLGVLLGAVCRGRVLGVLTVVRSATTAHPAHYSIDAASGRELSNLSIGPGLWWRAMLWAKSRGCARLDVEGNVIPLDPSHRRYEYENFKRRFAPAPIERVGEHVLVCSAAADSVQRAGAWLAGLERRAALRLREALLPERRGVSRTRPVAAAPRYTPPERRRDRRGEPATR